MVLSIVGVKEFLLHHVDALDLSSCSFPLQRSAISDQRTPAVWALSPSAGRHTALVALASAENF